jgi:hypothetical protein
MNEPTRATTTWTPEHGVPFKQWLIDDRPASCAPVPGLS